MSESVPQKIHPVDPNRTLGRGLENLSNPEDVNHIKYNMTIDGNQHSMSLNQLSFKQMERPHITMIHSRSLTVRPSKNDVWKTIRLPFGVR